MFFTSIIKEFTLTDGPAGTHRNWGAQPTARPGMGAASLPFGSQTARLLQVVPTISSGGGFNLKAIWQQASFPMMGFGFPASTTSLFSTYLFPYYDLATTFFSYYQFLLLSLSSRSHGECPSGNARRPRVPDRPAAADRVTQCSF